MFAEIKMENGKSKGCGAVRFDSPESAEKACRIMNGIKSVAEKLMFAWIVMHNLKPRLEHSYICFAESPSKCHFLK